MKLYRQTGKIRWALLLLMLLLFVGGAALWSYQYYERFRSTAIAFTDSGYTYTLKPGSSLRRLAEDLHQEGLVRHPLLLILLGRETGLASRMQAGEYEFLPGTTPVQLLEQLASGRVKQYELTIVEGHSFRQLMDRLAQHDALEHTLEELPGDAVMERLGLPDLHPEGQFLPDTYRFPRGTRDVDFLKRAHSALQQYLDTAWEGRAKKLPLKTPYEALTLASIVEKETGQASERPEIAGVFVRRLKKGMRLQTDPTVIYGMGEDFDGDIRFRDLRRDTPYNTYTRHGLPPTPIAMAGKAAIDAALHPADGKALYFVSRGDGSHVFSATLEAHNKAVRKYQLKR